MQDHSRFEVRHNLLSTSFSAEVNALVLLQTLSVSRKRSGAVVGSVHIVEGEGIALFVGQQEEYQPCGIPVNVCNVRVSAATDSLFSDLLIRVDSPGYVAN